MLVLDLGGVALDRLGEGGGLLVLVLAVPLRLVEPGAQVALLGPGQTANLAGVVRVALDQRERVQHRVVDVGGDLGPLLGADAHQALLGEVLGHANEVGAGEQGDADEDREGGLQHRAEVAAGAAQDEDAGGARRHQQHTRHRPQQRDRAPTAADLHPAGPARVVRLPPHQSHARADQDGRPEVGPGAVGEVHAAHEDHGHHDHEEQGDDLPLVRFPCDESAAAVRSGLGGDRRGRFLRVDAAHPERHEEPERGVQQGPETVGHEQGDEREAHPDHGQAEMSGEPPRHSPSQRPSLLR